MLFFWLFYLLLPHILLVKLKGTFSGVTSVTTTFKRRCCSFPIILSHHRQISHIWPAEFSGSLLVITIRLSAPSSVKWGDWTRWILVPLPILTYDCTIIQCTSFTRASTVQSTEDLKKTEANTVPSDVSVSMVWWVIKTIKAAIRMYYDILEEKWIV